MLSTAINWILRNPHQEVESTKNNNIRPRKESLKRFNTHKTTNSRHPSAKQNNPRKRTP